MVSILDDGTFSEENPFAAVEITFGADYPIPIADLANALVALDSLYQRKLQELHGDSSTRLAVSRVSEGSQIYELVPVAIPSIVYGSYLVMSHATGIADFFERLKGGISGFISPGGQTMSVSGPSISFEDASDIRAILEPLAGRKGASLGLKRLKIRKRDGDREIEAQAEFGSPDINDSVINIDRLRTDSQRLGGEIINGISERVFPEVTMLLDQAKRGPGKSKGRTGDRAVIPSISDKAVSVYFRQSIQDLKELMIEAEENPFGMTYIVTVSAAFRDGEPVNYTVIDIHDRRPI